MGWLLFLAEEFDNAALCQEIWHLTGVPITLVYWEIDRSLPLKVSNPSSQRKALHLE